MKGFTLESRDGPGGYAVAFAFEGPSGDELFSGLLPGYVMVLYFKDKASAVRGEHEISSEIYPSWLEAESSLTGVGYDIDREGLLATHQRA